MSEVAPLAASKHRIKGSPKDKSCLLNVMRRYLDRYDVDRSQKVLVLGGGLEDFEILDACGFKQIVFSNLHSSELPLDAEDIALPDDAYPVVFAHAILHHCRSPHKAVGEMVRVAQKHVFFFEPNDSAALRLLVRTGFSFPYELGAVITGERQTGGMRDGPIPNYIYRWTEHEVNKCVAAYHPERRFEVRSHPYWDFYVNEYELENRKDSRVALLAQRLGARNLIRLLHLGQTIMNVIPPLRAQGNKFFCVISKSGLQPWIEMKEGHPRLKEDGIAASL